MSRVKQAMFLAVLAVALARGPAAHAGAGEPQAPAECEAHARVAERIMRHRQESNDLEGTWRIAGLIRRPELSRFAQRLVPEAYRWPRETTGEDRERVAREFADEARAACQAAASPDFGSAGPRLGPRSRPGSRR